MTKRQEIEASVKNLIKHGWLDTDMAVTLLREYQSTLTPDMEPWEVAFEESFAKRKSGDSWYNISKDMFRDGYLAAKNEKGGK